MLYQINTRVWIRQFGPAATFKDVPVQYWAQLAAKGIKQVWLMGIWQTVDEAVLRYAMAPGLLAGYQVALPDWIEADVIGSPYAIDQYQPATALGDIAQLQALRAQLHGLGMVLILDFVPNHFHAETSLLVSHPEIFLEVNPQWRTVDGVNFYEPPQCPGRVFAHGKDPNYDAWQDTVQVNYQSKAAHDFMGQLLLQLANYCDGLRCDMAMLPQKDVFRRTWGHVLPQDSPAGEFWPSAIAAVKQSHPAFLFIAEVYWDMEWTLQQQGFDYTYDKRLLDRLKLGQLGPIRQHLEAGLDFQQRSLRFLENHDEERILSQMSQAQAMAAAIITYTIPGLSFFYEGQWCGQRVRLPVQLGREPNEKSCSCASASTLPGVVCACIARFYEQLLPLLNEPIQRSGQWQLLAGYGLLAWRWQGASGAERLVVVHYGAWPLQAPWPGRSGRWRERFSGQLWDIKPDDPPLHWYPYQYLIADLETDVHEP